MTSVIGQNAWFLCLVLCRSLGDMFTRKLSADVLFQRSVSALKPDTTRRAESMTGIILLRSGLLHLLGFMVLRNDSDCMLDELVRPS